MIKKGMIWLSELYGTEIQNMNYKAVFKLDLSLD